MSTDSFPQRQHKNAEDHLKLTSTLSFPNYSVTNRSESQFLSFRRAITSAAEMRLLNKRRINKFSVSWRGSDFVYDLWIISKLTLWSWVPLERPQVAQPLGSFPAFYGTRSFITEFTRALHLYLSCDKPIQSTTFNPISKRFILMLSIHLRPVFLVVSFPLAFLSITYTRSSSLQFVPHGSLFIYLVFIHSTLQLLVTVNVVFGFLNLFTLMMEAIRFS
jgi:hypothetical protein